MKASSAFIFAFSLLPSLSFGTLPPLPTLPRNFTFPPFPTALPSSLPPIPPVGFGVAATWYANRDFSLISTSNSFFNGEFNSTATELVAGGSSCISSVITTTLTPTTSGEHWFQIQSDGYFQLWIDNDILVLDASKAQSGKVNLDEGTTYSILVAYSCIDAVTYLRIQWRAPDATEFETIAPTQFVASTIRGLYSVYFAGESFDSGHQRATVVSPTPVKPARVIDSLTYVTDPTTGARYSGQMTLNETGHYRCRIAASNATLRLNGELVALEQQQDGEWLSPPVDFTVISSRDLDVEAVFINETVPTGLIESFGARLFNLQISTAAASSSSPATESFAVVQGLGGESFHASHPFFDAIPVVLPPSITGCNSSELGNVSFAGQILVMPRANCSTLKQIQFAYQHEAFAVLVLAGNPKRARSVPYIPVLYPADQIVSNAIKSFLTGQGQGVEFAAQMMPTAVPARRSVVTWWRESSTPVEVSPIYLPRNLKGLAAIFYYDSFNDTRVDFGLAYGWSTRAAPRAKNAAAIRWIGTFTPPPPPPTSSSSSSSSPPPLVLHFRWGGALVRLWVGGEVRMDGWNDAGNDASKFDVQLTGDDTLSIPIMIEYLSGNLAQAEMRVLWTRDPDVHMEEIPGQYWTPTLCYPGRLEVSQNFFGESARCVCPLDRINGLDGDICCDVRPYRCFLSDVSQCDSTWSDDYNPQAIGFPSCHLIKDNTRTASIDLQVRCSFNDPLPSSVDAAQYIVQHAFPYVLNTSNSSSDANPFVLSELPHLQLGLKLFDFNVVSRTKTVGVPVTLARDSFSKFERIEFNTSSLDGYFSSGRVYVEASLGVSWFSRGVEVTAALPLFFDKPVEDLLPSLPSMQPLIITGVVLAFIVLCVVYYCYRKRRIRRRREKAKFM